MAFNPREVFPELFETEEPAIPQVVISPPKEAVPPLMQSEKASLGIETEKKTKFNPREVFPELFGPPPELPPEPIPPVKASLLPVSPFVIPKTEPQRLPERGILGDIGAAAVGGLRDVAEMGLRGLRTISPFEKAYEEGPLGKAIEALKDTDKWDIMKPSKEVVEGPWYRRWIYEGVRSALPSLSSMITGAAVGQALIPVPVVGAVAGAAAGQALSALPFGASEYDRFMEEAREKGLNEEEVKPYALASGLTEWMGETLGNWLGAKLLRMAPGGQQLTEPLKNTIRQMFKVPLKEGAKDLVKEYINEAGTEFGQNALENWLRTKAGMPQEQSPLQEGLESVGPTIVMTSIFGLGAGALNRSRRQQIYKALQDNTIAPEERRKAVNDITYGLYQEAGFKPQEIETVFNPEIDPQKKAELHEKVIERQKDPETSRQLLEIASQWDIAANTAIQNQQPINIDMTVEDYLDSLSSQRRTETAEEKEEAEPAPVVSPAKPAEQPPAPQKPKREVPWSVGEQVELQGKPYTILKPEEFDDFVSQKSKIRRITTLVKNGIVEPVPVPREEVKVVRKAGQAEAREEKPQEQPAALPQQPPPAPTPPVAEEAREKTAPKAEAVPEEREEKAPEIPEGWPRGLIPTEEIWNKTPMDIRNEWWDAMDRVEQHEAQVKERLDKVREQLDALKGQRGREALDKRKALKKEIDEVTAEMSFPRSVYENKNYDYWITFKEQIEDAARKRGVPEEYVPEFADQFLLEISDERPYIEYNHNRKVSDIFEDVIQEYLEKNKPEVEPATEEKPAPIPELPAEPKTEIAQAIAQEIARGEEKAREDLTRRPVYREGPSPTVPLQPIASAGSLEDSAAVPKPTMEPAILHVSARPRMEEQATASTGEAPTLGLPKPRTIETEAETIGVEQRGGANEVVRVEKINLTEDELQTLRSKIRSSDLIAFIELHRDSIEKEPEKVTADHQGSFFREFGLESRPRSEIETPVGKVTVTREHYLKLAQHGDESRKEFIRFIRPTLERPNEVWETSAGERNYLKLFRDGGLRLHTTMVKVKKDGTFYVTNIPISNFSKMSKIIKKGTRIYPAAPKPANEILPQSMVPSPGNLIISPLGEGVKYEIPVASQGETLPVKEARAAEELRTEVPGKPPAQKPAAPPRVETVVAPETKPAPTAEATTKIEAQQEWGAKNKIFTKERADRAREILRRKATELRTGIDPELLQAGIDLAGFHIEAGARKFVDYASRMIEEIGDWIRPYLKSFYNAVRDYPDFDSEGMDTYDDVSKIDLDKIGRAPIIEGERRGEEYAAERAEPGETEGVRPGTLEGVQTENVPEAEEGGRAGAEPGAGGEEYAGGLSGYEAEAPGEGVYGGPGPQVGVGAGEGGVAPAAGRGVGERNEGTEVIRKPSPVGTNFRIDRPTEEALTETGPKTKARNNIAAIELLKKIESENRLATPEEQAVLAKYTGWGGLPQVFAWNKEQEYGRLRDLLTPEEYASARESTLNAHYTSPEVVRFMWKAIEKMGFRGGRVLEPSMGTGIFYGLIPDSLVNTTQLSGVELDSITGRIAKQLYQNADIRVMGYEKVTYPDNFFDLAISNVPFGDYKIYDPRYTKYNAKIHNYFFLKSLDKVRPGGLVAFITTHYTMDSASPRIRKAIAEKADLLAAIRLPKTAFKGIANTEVVTDIIFLRKRVEGEEPRGEAWIDTRKIKLKDEEGEAEFSRNEYFDVHPDHILGIESPSGSMYTKREYTVEPKAGLEIQAALDAVLEKLPSRTLNILSPETSPGPKIEITSSIPAPDYVKEGAFVVHEGKIYQNEQGQLLPVDIPEKQIAKTKHLIKLRDATRALLHKEIEAENDEDFKQEMETLNKEYDKFVKLFGLLHDPKNIRNLVFADDPDYPLVLSLEKWDEENKKASKADIFTKRVIQPFKRIERVDTAKEALVVSLSETGRINFPRMSELTGKSEEELQRELAGLIFLNPEGEQWETADEYLSGNIRQKLKIAESAAAVDEKYKPNVEALRAVQPEDIPFDQIDAKLGASWIPPNVISQFIEEVLGIRGGLRVNYSPAIASWVVETSRSNFYRINSVENTETYGTPHYDGVDLLGQALNNRIPTVKIRDDEGNLRVDSAATEAAREKQHNLKMRFKTWIWEDSERRQALVRKYNDEMNNMRPRTFDGSHLMLPGAVPEDVIKLRPHQKDAIWRILQTPTTLLAHAVGAGKTFTMVGAAMELRRLGIAKKPMFVVPNHMVKQFASEFLQLYPGAKILAPTKKDFSLARRNILMSRIATGDWDAVIVPHSSFGKVPMSDKAVVEFLEKQLNELQNAIMDLEAAGEDRRRSRIIKQIEAAQRRLQEKIERRLAAEKKTVNVTFEELGVDQLFVDEAHYFKNLLFATKMGNIAGISTSASNRAEDLYLKTDYLLSKYGRGVTFATGTPISNTMAEMYTMQRYLQPGVLAEHGISHFDAWASNFGEIVVAEELAPEGTKYRVNSRFARFSNITELQRMFRMIADVKTAEELGLPLPEIAGGKPEVIVSPASDDLKTFVADLARRAEEIRSGTVDKSVDNMLKVTTDGRKAALDMRLISPALNSGPDSKINKAVAKIYEHYKAGDKDKLTQVVFCDLGTPKTKAKGVEGEEEAGLKFNVYEDIRKKLVSVGIPRNEIAFIHEYTKENEKQKLFDMVNSGEIRVVIGSTDKMGVGTNMQKRLIAAHHLDAPYRPADIEQRNGRIIRQGNQNKAVHIYYYVTEGSFDAYIWQLLENKAKFITQVMTSDVRVLEDISGATLTYEEVKAIASGNPLIKDKVRTDARVRRLESLRSQYVASRSRMQDEISRAIAEIASNEKAISLIEQDLAERAIPTNFAITVDGKEYTDRKEAGEAIQKISGKLFSEHVKGIQSGKRLIGRYANLDLVIDPAIGTQWIHVGNSGSRAAVSESPAGTIQSIEYATGKGLELRLQNSRVSIDELRKKIDRLQQELTKPFEHEEELKELFKKQDEINTALGLNKSEAGVDTDELKENLAPEPEKGREAEEEEEAEYAIEREPVPRGAEVYDQYGHKVSGLTVAEVESFVAPIVEKWAIGDVVRVVQGVEDVPRRYRHPGMTAVHIPEWKKIILVADRIRNKADAERRLFHEALGHYGLREMFGNRLDVFLEQVYPQIPVLDLDHIADTWGFDLTTREGRIKAASEYMAILAERTRGMAAPPTLLQRLYAKIRELLRELGFSIELKDFEIRAALARAARMLEARATELGVEARKPTTASVGPEYAVRTPWNKGTSKVIVHTTISKLKAHPDYQAAKNGDPLAAVRLADDLLNKTKLNLLRAKLKNERRVIVAPVVLFEENGKNAIPRAMAEVIAQHTGWEVADDLVQSNYTGHTKKGAVGRLLSQAEFNGEVVPGATYVLVDDVVTQGGTLANLKGYIEHNGGNVKAIMTLGAAQFSANLAVSKDTVEALRKQYGQNLKDLLNWIYGEGVDEENLTESEARTILREGPTLDRRRVAGAQGLLERGRQSGPGISGKEVREEAPEIVPPPEKAPEFSLLNPTERPNPISQPQEGNPFDFLSKFKSRYTLNISDNDLGKIRAFFGNPWDVAQKDPQFRKILDRQLLREESREELLHKLLSNTIKNSPSKQHEFLALPADQRNKLFKVMVWSDANNTILAKEDELRAKARELGVGELTKEQISAYYAWKRRMNEAWKMILDQAEKMTFKQFEGRPWFEELKILAGHKKRGASEEEKASYEAALERIKAMPEEEQKRFELALVRVEKPASKIRKMRTQMGRIQYYVPRVREQGKYVIRVYDSEDNLVHSERTNSTFKGKQIENRLRARFGNGYKIEKTIEKAIPESIFQTVSDISIEKFIERAVDRAQKNESVQPEDAKILLNALFEAVTDQLKQRGFGQHMIKRREGAAVTGYETEDGAKVFLDYMSGLAGFLTKQEAAFDFYKLLHEIPIKYKPELFEYANNYIRDMLRNLTDLERLSGKARSIAFAYWLSGNLKSAAMQFSQNFVTGIPWLGRHTKHPQKKYIQAMKDVAVDNLTEEERRALDEAINRGITTNQYVKEITGNIRGGLSGFLGKVIDVLSMPFSGMEIFNRKSAFLAMFRVARDEEKLPFEEAVQKARDYVYETHYLYGKANLPPWARSGTTGGAIARTSYTFRSFTHNYLLSMIRSLKGEDGKIAIDVLARSLAYLFLFGGVTALPFLDDLLDELEQKLGIPYRANMRKALKGIGGEMLEKFGMRGLPALIGVDLSGSLKTALPTLSLRGVEESVYGVYGGLFDKGQRVLDDLARGEILRAIESGAPAVIESPLKAYRMYEEGATTPRGKLIYDEEGHPIRLTAPEALGQAFGFRPERLAAASTERRVLSNIEEHYKDIRDNLYAKYRMARNEEERRNVLKDVERYNLEVMKYRGAIPMISRQSLQQAITQKPPKPMMRFEQMYLQQ